MSVAGSGGFGSPLSWNLLVHCPRPDGRALLIGQESLEVISAAPPLGVFTGLSSDPTRGNPILLEEPTSKLSCCLMSRGLQGQQAGRPSRVLLCSRPCL